MHPPTRLIAALSMAACAVTLAFGQINPPGGGGSGGGTTLPTPNVQIYQRDYQGNLPATDRSHFPNPLSTIEWGMTPGPSVSVTHVAYVKGASATFKLKFVNNLPFPVTGSVSFTDARLEVPGPNSANPTAPPIPLTISSSGGFAMLPYGVDEETATISGLPNHVAVGALQVKFDIPYLINIGGYSLPGMDGSGGTWQTWERICVLDAAPVGLQAVPWTDFLEFTCRWAYGASGDSSVINQMTIGLNKNAYCPYNRLVYDPNVNNFYFIDPTSTVGVSYNLRALLQSIKEPYLSSANDVHADCRDYAGLLQLALSSHGVFTGCSLVQTASGSFAYWPLCPGGSDPSVLVPRHGEYSSGNYVSGYFNFHVIVVKTAFLVYDASSSYLFSTAGAYWQQPILGLDASSYWQAGLPRYGLAHDTILRYSFDSGPNSGPVSAIWTTNLSPTGLQ